MTWLQRYRVRHYVGNSIWILPVLSTLAAIAAVRLLHWIERERAWVSPLDPDTARAVLGALASLLFTSIVFICTALLVAMQLASAALTPRIIALVFKDSTTKFSLTLLAYYVEWQMRQAWQSLLFADEELGQARRERDPVKPAEASESAKAKKKTKQTAQGMPAHSFATLLAHLATRCRNTHQLLSEPAEATFQQITEPDALQAEALRLLKL